jgi:hypothetical protein
MFANTCRFRFQPIVFAPLRLCLSLLCALIVMPSVLVGQTPQSDPLAALKTFIDDQTIAVTEFDLAHLDVTAATKLWLEPIAITEAQRDILSVVVDQFQHWAERLRSEGVTRFYIVTTTEYMPTFDVMHRWRYEFVAGLISHSTYAVVPGASGGAIDEFHRLLQTKAKQVWPNDEPKMWPDCRLVHGGAAVGMGTLLDQLGSIKPTARPEFRTALTAAGESPMRLAIVPPPIFARAAEEILRDPVPGTDKAAGPILAHGFRWLSLGVEPDLAKFTAQLVIQSDGQEAGKAFADALKHGFEELVRGQSNFEALSPESLQLLSLIPEAKGDRLVVSLDGPRVAVVRAIAEQAFTRAAAAAFRQESMNHIKQIGLAMHNYRTAEKHFPPAAIRDKNGKPLLSWRVAILPWIDEGRLYKEFHLDEPWDSEHNRKLIDRMPDVYKNPDTAAQQPGRTRYLVPVGSSTMFPLDQIVDIKDITDGTVKTIMTIEVDSQHAVIWTKPDDLEVELDDPARGIFNGDLPAVTGFADGSAYVLRRDINPKTLRAMLTRNGGEYYDFNQ